jgi:hypothetical protein
VALAFGADYSAAPVNPIYGLLLAATRMNYRGEFNWGPDQTIPVADSIRHYTIGSARAMKMENDIGSIEVGKYGDFALFDIDLLDIASSWFLLTHELEIGGLDNFVLMTVTGGRIVYERPGENY